MSQSLAQVYLHIIFSTKYRQPLIDDFIKEELYTYLGGTCKSLACTPVIVGGHIDHVHMLCRLSKKISIMKLTEEVKRESSRWIKTKNIKYNNFYWQDGYAAFSVNPSELFMVKDYIINQPYHHREKTYQEECRIFFEKYQLDFDERYVWG